MADIAYPDAYIRHKGQGHLIPLPGQAQNVFIPRTVLGVNASGKQQDRAAFLCRSSFVPADSAE